MQVVLPLSSGSQVWGRIIVASRFALLTALLRLGVSLSRQTHGSFFVRELTFPC